MTTTTPPKRSRPPHEAAALFVRELVTRYTKHHGVLTCDGGAMGGQIVLALRAHRDDQPRIVGSQGRNIGALQALARAYGARLGLGLRLTLLEPVTGEKMPREEFRENPEWKHPPTKRLLEKVLACTLDGEHRTTHKTVGDLSYLEIEPAPAQEFVGYLHTIFHAIGRNEGRLIEVLGNGQAGI